MIGFVNLEDVKRSLRAELNPPKYEANPMDQFEVWHYVNGHSVLYERQARNDDIAYYQERKVLNAE